VACTHSHFLLDPHTAAADPPQQEHRAKNGETEAGRSKVASVA
jgi:hypothetical protein